MAILPNKTNDTDINITVLLKYRAAVFPNHICYSFPESGQTLTWQTLWLNAVTMATNLRNTGIRKGDRIAMLMEGGTELVVSIFASIIVGAIAVPINSFATKRELIVYLSQAQAKILIIDNSVKQVHYKELIDDKDIDQDDKSLWLPEHIYVQSQQPVNAPFHCLSELTKLKSVNLCLDELPFPAGAFNDPIFYIFTSGTTGAPKGVSRSLSSFMTKERARKSKHQFFRRLADKHVNRYTALSLLPLYHLAGIGMLLMPLHICNVRMAMLIKFNPVRALESIDSSRSRFLVGTPYMIQSILNASFNHKTNLRSITGIVFTSSALEYRTIEKVVKGFCNLSFFMVSYGSSETGQVANATCFLPRQRNPAVMLLLRFMKRINQLHGVIALKEFAGTTGSIGGLIGKGIQVNIRCPDTERQLSVNEHGEIVILNQSVTDIPYGASLNNHFTKDGWYKSGDIGYINDLGRLIITGRIKRMISRGGEKISPVEIEQAILQHPAIEDAFVIGVPHSMYGEEIGAAYIKRPGLDVSVSELLCMLQSSLSKFKVPSLFVELEDVPLTPSGKVSAEAILAAILSKAEYITPNA